jgi:hypothetical protein
MIVLLAGSVRIHIRMLFWSHVDDLNASLDVIMDT